MRLTAITRSVATSKRLTVCRATRLGRIRGTPYEIPHSTSRSGKRPAIRIAEAPLALQRQRLSSGLASAFGVVPCLCAGPVELQRIFRMHSDRGRPTASPDGEDKVTVSRMITAVSCYTLVLRRSESRPCDHVCAAYKYSSAGGTADEALRGSVWCWT